MYTVQGNDDPSQIIQGEMTPSTTISV